MSRSRGQRFIRPPVRRIRSFVCCPHLQSPCSRYASRHANPPIQVARERHCGFKTSCASRARLQSCRGIIGATRHKTDFVVTRIPGDVKSFVSGREKGYPLPAEDTLSVGRRGTLLHSPPASFLLCRLLFPPTTFVRFASARSFEFSGRQKRTS